MLAHDLVDELRLLTFPLLLGKGKRLFGSGAVPMGLELVKSTVSPSGAVITAYERSGDVKRGSFELVAPTAAELERRRNLT